jgi:YbbR domain-containing protein
MTSNLPLKAVSLLIAVLLAYAVNSASNSSVVSLIVPIEVQNTPEDKILVRPTKRAVQVTIKGPSFLVGPIASSPPTLRVKLPDLNEDRFLVNLKSSDLSLPPTVDVLSVDPPEMEFVFETVESREIRVEVPRVGQLAKDLTLERIEIDPKTITVKGPRSELRQLRALETEPIDLAEIEGDRALVVRVRPPSSQVNVASSSVKAAIFVEAVPRERMLDARPVEVRASPELPSMKLEPSEVSVVVAGDREAIAKLAPTSVIPYVRPKAGSNVESEVAEVSVELPQGIRLVKVEPKSVRLQREFASKVPVKGKSQKAR